ncbi:amidohydrolase family protein [Sutcliffiella horikoshii]|uniref:amidohydrolase n=1 Tax=Sutcliffiella horikoshii TaxID=79883 RepID=UPI00384B041F
MNRNSYWLKNVRIEAGFEQEDNRLKTLTEMVHLKVVEGKIAALSQEQPKDNLPEKDAKGLLLLPSLKEMHIHIDKTYYGGPWKACTPITNGIFTRIEEEKKLLPQQLATAQERAEKVIELYLKHGHSHIRTHCNIDPSIGLKNLEATLNAVNKYKDVMTFEIVAFPQHGLLRSEVAPLVKEAMEMGATHVGGVDPATIDRNIEKSLDTIFDIAVQSGSSVDVHIHDANSLGAFTFERMAHYTKQAGLQGRTTISHAIALGDLETVQLEETVKMLVDNKIDVTTTVPINRPTIPIPLLTQMGLMVSLGHDSITDHWSPFGTANTIEKMCVLAERFRLIDEKSLSSLVQYGTGGINSLSAAGERQWPKIGDDASMILVDASCSAEAVARRTDVKALFYKGKEVKPMEMEKQPIAK